MTDGYAVTVRRDIAAPAEELFDAWLDGQSLGTWFRPAGVRETRAETDPRVGGTFRIVMVHDGSTVCSGTYREIDRPRRLVFSWSSPDTRSRDTIVTVTFQPSSTGTVVEVHQVGLPDEEARGLALRGLVGHPARARAHHPLEKGLFRANSTGKLASPAAWEASPVGATVRLVPTVTSSRKGATATALTGCSDLLAPPGWSWSRR